ncbi:GntR family transcriptional regulator [Streptomyces antimicrobicus]|uniref:GntR family transcriptional regulator n=1 Tax=Streptomyces antimicrobicus TaxID=2883108 RepID=A0ABS8BEC3_9ACTN|nr:GntR family transcriptional regulator [Streptomyces antimicrobicus]MCB5182874.1 GntR family transcriptional regulator [Streptomyces antimicrobicus]
MSEGEGYAGIAAYYAERIRKGEIPAGSKLPSLRDVCDAHGVSMKTAARAFNQLKAWGLTIPKPGVGTIAAAPVSDNIEGRVKTYAATGRALAAGETSEILEIGTVAADEIVASRLDIEPGTPVAVRRRVVSRDGVPTHYSSSYYPSYVISAVPELMEPVSTGGSRELASERLGSAQKGVLEEVTCRFATEVEKSALGLTGSVQVMQIVRTVHLKDGRIVEVGVKIVSGSTPLKWYTDLE